MNKDELVELAKKGAQAELNALETRMGHLRELLEKGPHLGRIQQHSTVRKKRRMSAEARKAVSERMKKYWASKKK